MPDDLTDLMGEPAEIIPPTEPPVVEPPVEPPVVEPPVVPPIEEPIDYEAIAAKKYQIKCATNDIISDLSPLIREEDVIAVRNIAEESELSAVLDYLKNNIPDVNIYLSGVPIDASDELKIKAIKEGLKKRAEGMVPDYEMPPPWLGNEIEEARSKQENASTRYITQYGQVPFVKPVYRGRSAIDNPYYETPVQRKVYRNPKSTRIKFL